MSIFPRPICCMGWHTKGWDDETLVWYHWARIVHRVGMRFQYRREHPGKQYRTSHHRWTGKGNKASDRRWKFQRILNQPSKRVSCRLASRSRWWILTGTHLLTWVPPSPGRVLYQKSLCGPAMGIWSWSPWAADRLARARIPAIDLNIVEKIKIETENRFEVGILEVTNWNLKICGREIYERLLRNYILEGGTEIYLLVPTAYFNIATHCPARMPAAQICPFLFGFLCTKILFPIRSHFCDNYISISQRPISPIFAPIRLDDIHLGARSEYN